MKLEKVEEWKRRGSKRVFASQCCSFFELFVLFAFTLFAFCFFSLFAILTPALIFFRFFGCRLGLLFVDTRLNGSTCLRLHSRDET